jgi:hypothetical protein
LVTGVFNGAAGAFATALETGFALDGLAVVLVPALTSVFGVAAFTGLLTFAGTAFLAIGLDAVLEAAFFAVLAEDAGDFVGFFIAFAMESTTD